MHGFAPELHAHQLRTDFGEVLNMTAAAVLLHRVPLVYGS